MPHHHDVSDSLPVVGVEKPHEKDDKPGDVDGVGEAAGASAVGASVVGAGLAAHAGVTSKLTRAHGPASIDSSIQAQPPPLAASSRVASTHPPPWPSGSTVHSPASLARQVSPPACTIASMLIASCWQM